MKIQKFARNQRKWGSNSQSPKICTNIDSISGSNYIQCYSGPKIECNKANRGHKQSWLFKTRSICVQNGQKMQKIRENGGQIHKILKLVPILTV